MLTGAAAAPLDDADAATAPLDDADAAAASLDDADGPRGLPRVCFRPVNYCCSIGSNWNWFEYA